MLRFESINDLPEKFREQAAKQIEEQKKRIVDVTVKADEPPKTPTRKYHNTPTERLLPNGETIKFRSKKEAAYFDGLKAMELAGLVRNIRLEVQYLLKPAYTDGTTGERFRAISYLADFVYEKQNDNGEWVLHIVDTKGGGKGGTRTATYRLKRKLMAENGLYVEEA